MGFNRDRNGWYGNDDKTNRFKDPKTNETYFTLVNEKTGEIELWNEDFGFADKKVGTLDPETGKMDYNGKWFSNVNADDKAFAEKIIKNGDLKKQANIITAATIADEENCNGDKECVKKAKIKAQKLIDKNKGLDVGSQSKLAAATSKLTNSAAGEAVDGTRKDGFGRYVYPQTLRQREERQDFLKFNMLKYEPRPFNKEGFGFQDRSDTNKRIIGTVILPIPGNIQDGQSVKWGDKSMSPIDMAKANIALAGITGGGDAFADAVGNQASSMADAFGTDKDALAAVIAGWAAGGQDILTRTTGAIANPNMELLFGGPNLRNFSFQWTLAPRNDKEAKEVIKILRFFKQGMSPIRTKSRLFMKSPHTFQLSYNNSKGEPHKYLNKFKECALQSFTVNYAPNGNYSTYEDGVMTAYQMSMTYSELNPVFNDDYGSDPSGSLPAEVGF
tara:strand:+ start:76 stop:1410 length:1335 start_codon:yes stop_codon:yes gene_type:complete